MNKIYNYQDEWKKIKAEQKVWVDKYNRAISEKMKQKYCSEILRYEADLSKLRDKYESKLPTKG